MNVETNEQFMLLPKLLYVGDVPVESSYHGSALLFRLLEGYPVDRLCVAECGSTVSQPSRRLPGGTYVSVPPSALATRLQTTRWNHWGATWQMLTATSQAGRIAANVPFAPESILAVAHGFSWFAAAKLAREWKIPLHLIVHDDWPNITPVVRGFVQGGHTRFGRIYREAASRLCVSPGMEQAYLSRYGVPGQVLYPSRKSGGTAYDTPPPRLSSSDRPFTVGYAGTISSFGYAGCLKLAADALRNLGGRMNLYGPMTREDAGKLGLDAGNVQVRGLIPSDALVPLLREECDAMVIPMSFDPEDTVPVSLNFPSKLTDCTATALPLLIVGSDTASGISWAKQFPGVALTVTENSLARVQDALARLRDDEAFAVQLGTTAARVGTELFSASQARRILHERLLQDLKFRDS